MASGTAYGVADNIANADTRPRNERFRPSMTLSRIDLLGDDSNTGGPVISRGTMKPGDPKSPERFLIDPVRLAVDADDRIGNPLHRFIVLQNPGELSANHAVATTPFDTVLLDQ